MDKCATLLFDDVAVDKVQDAEAAILKNMVQFPAELPKRLFAAKPLNDGDHDLILKIAGELLAPFKEKAEPDQPPK